MTYTELQISVEKKEIVSAKNKEGIVYRLFHATNGRLCYFPKGKKRFGTSVDSYLFESFVSFAGKKAPKSDEAMLKSRYNDIAKYKRLAQSATFTNYWIEDCKNLPDFEAWKKDLIVKQYGSSCEPTQKSLYELNITTGNRIDAVVISLSRIEKKYEYAIASLRDAIKNKKAVGTIISNSHFAGYDMTISVEEKATGELFGYLSLEYKGTGNGYYYSLINDENFIGYDVD